MNLNCVLSTRLSNISALGNLLITQLQEIPKSNNSSSPFIAEGTAQEALLHLLYSMGIINKHALLTTDFLEPLPFLDTTQRQVFEEHFDAAYLSTTKKEFFRSAQTHGNEILDIEGVGGIARKVFLSSKTFILKVLSALTKLPKELLSIYITDELLSEKDRVLPDIDVRTIIPKAKKRDLYTCTSIALRKILELTDMLEEEFRNCSSKFNVIYDEHNQFSIISFKSFELLYVIKLFRQHLFTLDAIKISFFQYLLDDSAELEFKSDLGNGGQTLIDLLTRVIHIQKPETADHLAFPMLISYFVRGYVFGDPQQKLQILLNRAKEIRKNHIDIPSSIATLLSSSYKAHHSQDIHTILAITGTAWMTLRNDLPAQELGKLWELLENEFWAEQTEKLPNSPLGKIALFMLSPKVSSLTLEEKSGYLSTLFSSYTLGTWLHLSSGKKSASIGIRNHLDSPALQLPSGNSFFLVPMSFSEAFDKLVSALSNDLQQEALEIIEQTAFSHYQEETCITFSFESLTQCGFDPYDLDKKAETLFKIRNRSAQFIGYLCLLASQTIKPDAQSIPQLLEKFISSVGARDSRTRTFVIKNLITIAEKTSEDFLIEVLQKSNNSIEKVSSEKELLSTWLKCLATCRETKIARLVCSLWIQYREKYPLELRRKYDLEIVCSIAPNSLETSLSLFLISLQTNYFPTSDLELMALNTLLKSILMGSTGQLAVNLSKIIDILTSMFQLGKLFTTKTFPDDLLKNMIQILQAILQKGNYLIGRSLWELLAQHPLFSKEKADIEHGWMLLTQAALEHQGKPNEAARIWKKTTKTHSNKELYFSTLYALTKRMLEFRGNETQGILNLKILFRLTKGTEANALTLHYLNSLISSRHLKKAFYILHKFHFFFTVQEKETFYIQLLEELLNTKEWGLAANIWFLLPASCKNTPLTFKLIQGLIPTKTIKGAQHSFNLLLALKILNKIGKIDSSYGRFLISIGNCLLQNPNSKYYIAFLHVISRKFFFFAAKDLTELAYIILQLLPKISHPSERVLKKTLHILPLLSDLLPLCEDSKTVSSFLSVLHSVKIPSFHYPLFYKLSAQIVEPLIKMGNIPQAFVWISNGIHWCSPETLSTWLRSLLIYFSGGNHEDFLAFVKTFRKVLQRTLPLEEIESITEAWLANLSSFPSKTINLISHYPPKESATWQTLFRLADQDNLLILYVLFRQWWETKSEYHKDQIACWLEILKVIQTLEPSPFKTLYKDFISDTNFARIFQTDPIAWIEACGLILEGFLPTLQEKQDFEAFLQLFDFLVKHRFVGEVHYRKWAIMIQLLDQIPVKDSIDHFNLSFRMLSSTILFAKKNPEAQNVFPMLDLLSIQLQASLKFPSQESQERLLDMALVCLDCFIIKNKSVFELLISNTTTFLENFYSPSLEMRFSLNDIQPNFNISLNVPNIILARIASAVSTYQSIHALQTCKVSVK